MYTDNDDQWGAERLVRPGLLRFRVFPRAVWSFVLNSGLVMYIKLREPMCLFFPGEIIAAGQVVSIGGPRGRLLVSQGRAEPADKPPDVSRPAAPASSEAERRLWEAHLMAQLVTPTTPTPPSISAVPGPTFGGLVKEKIKAQLGPYALRARAQVKPAKEESFGQTIKRKIQAMSVPSRKLKRGSI